MVKPQFVGECRLLFYRVYQEPPKNNEIYLKFATCFIYERCYAAKAYPEAHKIAWALVAENVTLSLKRNPIAWKRKVDALRDTHGPINVITTSDSMPGPSMQADVKGRPESCVMSSVIKKLCAKILDIQSNNKAKVLKNELKEKKVEFLNKRDALIRREAIASAASMIQTKITSLQTRYGTLKGANAIAEQLAALEAQITTMSSAVKLIEGDDKIANMKIVVESIENGVGVEEGNVYNLEIASPGGAEKSWSDCEAAKNVGHDTVPPKSIVLGATSEEGVEAILGGDTDVESVFLVEFVKRFKSNKRTATTIAPGEDKRKPCAQSEEVIIKELSKVVPSTVQTNQTLGRLALLVDLNGVLVYTFCPHLKEQLPDLDSNDHSVVKEQYSTTYTIPLKSDAKPIRQHPYTYNETFAKKIKEEIDKLKEAEFIYEIEHTKWVSPIVVVPKRNEKLRVCVNRKKVNAATIQDNYPLPITNHVIERVAEREAYTFLDEFLGYN
ncbi:hypothetical protein L7F22_032264 [Adiantum nelumboides]|nr:hypothetical protein [Adiantum nelumboides]